jgi:hypothetical protein
MVTCLSTKLQFQGQLHPSAHSEALPYIRMFFMPRSATNNSTLNCLIHILVFDKIYYSLKTKGATGVLWRCKVPLGAILVPYSKKQRVHEIETDFYVVCGFTSFQSRVLTHPSGRGYLDLPLGWYPVEYSLGETLMPNATIHYNIHVSVCLN